MAKTRISRFHALYNALIGNYKTTDASGKIVIQEGWTPHNYKSLIITKNKVLVTCYKAQLGKLVYKREIPLDMSGGTHFIGAEGDDCCLKSETMTTKASAKDLSITGNVTAMDKTDALLTIGISKDALLSNLREIIVFYGGNDGITLPLDKGEAMQVSPSAVLNYLGLNKLKAFYNESHKLLPLTVTAIDAAKITPAEYYSATDDYRNQKITAILGKMSKIFGKSIPMYEKNGYWRLISELDAVERRNYDVIYKKAAQTNETNMHEFCCSAEVSGAKLKQVLLRSEVLKAPSQKGCTVRLECSDTDYQVFYTDSHYGEVIEQELKNCVINNYFKAQAAMHALAIQEDVNKRREAKETDAIKALQATLDSLKLGYVFDEYSYLTAIALLQQLSKYKDQAGTVSYETCAALNAFQSTRGQPLDAIMLNLVSSTLKNHLTKDECAYIIKNIAKAELKMHNQPEQDILPGIIYNKDAIDTAKIDNIIRSVSENELNGMRQFRALVIETAFVFFILSLCLYINTLSSDKVGTQRLMLSNIFMDSDNIVINILQDSYCHQALALITGTTYQQIFAALPAEYKINIVNAGTNIAPAPNYALHSYDRYYDYLSAKVGR